MSIPINLKITQLTSKQDYTLRIGITTFLSALLITVFSVMKDRSDKNEADLKDKQYRDDLQAARDTIIHQQRQVEQQAANYNEVSLKKFDSLNKQQYALIELQGKAVTQLRENEKKAEYLDSLQKRTINEITGGDSFCEMRVGVGASNDTALINFYVHGKYPIPQLRATILDYNKEGVNHHKWNYMGDTFLDLGTLPPGGSRFYHQIKVDKEKGVSMAVVYHGSFGGSAQRLRIRFINGQWLSSTVIYKNNKKVYEKIDEGFLE